MVYTMPKEKTPKKILRSFLIICGWLDFNQYGTQGQFFRWSLPPMMPVSQREHSTQPQILYLDRLFASTISKVSVKDCGLNHSKVATLIWTTQLVLAVLVFYCNADTDPHQYITASLA